MIAWEAMRRHHPSCPARAGRLGCICPPSTKGVKGKGRPAAVPATSEISRVGHASSGQSLSLIAGGAR